MADTKITSLLTPQVTTNPATDVLPIVNIADTSMASSGSTRKITVNQLLGAGGTATLASATITGDLTVDTSTLKVDSANNRVGIGTASPAETLHVSGGNIRMSINQFLYLYYGSATNYASLGADNSGNVQVFTGLTSPANRFQIANDGVCTWSNVGGVAGTAMTLNSTGLGVGVTPNRNLDIRQDQSAATIARIQNQSVNAAAYSQVNLSASGNNWGILVGSSAANSNRLEFVVDPSGTNLSVMRLDTSGNVGIGVTPSAWNTAYAVAQVGIGGSIWSLKSTYYDQFGLGCNHFENTSGSDRYVNNGRASQYFQYQGTHIFRIAGNNTLGAGAALTWTPAMMLDASGNLLVGKTATNSNTVGVEIQPNGNVWATKSASTSAATAWDTYSTGAGAYRFYVGMNGTINATNTTISAISDARLKENVQDIDVGLGAILALKPRKFDWKAGKGKDIKGDRGFIAQEFEQVFPNLIDEWKDPAPEGEAPYKSVRQDLIPVLVKAIQELAAEVNALKNA